VEDGLIDSLSFSSAEKVSRSSSVNGKIAFVFTGQGAQWHGMAKGLILGSPAFRESIREMDKTLQELNDPPSWTIEGKIAKAVCFGSFAY
jgi:acyl transferase domain-containing protein